MRLTIRLSSCSERCRLRSRWTAGAPRSAPCTGPPRPGRWSSGSRSPSTTAQSDDIKRFLRRFYSFRSEPGCGSWSTFSLSCRPVGSVHSGHTDRRGRHRAGTGRRGSQWWPAAAGAPPPPSSAPPRPPCPPQASVQCSVESAVLISLGRKSHNGDISPTC